MREGGSEERDGMVVDGCFFLVREDGWWKTGSVSSVGRKQFRNGDRKQLGFQGGQNVTNLCRFAQIQLSWCLHLGWFTAKMACPQIQFDAAPGTPSERERTFGIFMRRVGSGSRGRKCCVSAITAQQR